MAFKNIEQIKIGNNAPGLAFGGYIYSLSCSVGSASAPSTVTVNVVNENGLYGINDSNLTSTNPVRIIVDSNGASPLVFAEMYLTSYEINESLGNKILTLNYKDSSVILDKIHVGLYEREGTEQNLTGLVWILEKKPIRTHFSVPITCPPCDVDKPPVNMIMAPTQDIWTAFVTNADLKNGGTILLGTQEFKDNVNKIAEISYTFQHLLDGLALMGFKIIGLNDRNRSGRTGKHSGSLREVLNNWCAELGFNFAWDFSTNTIFGIDLTQPVIPAYLQAIENIVRNLDAGSGSAVQDINKSSSIDDTVVKHYTSFYLRDTKVVSFDKDFVNEVTFKNIKVADVIPCNHFGPRNEKEFLTSCALSKYNRKARTIYNWKLLAGCNDFSPLGIKIKYKFTDDEKRRLLNYNFSVKEIVDIQKKYGKNCRAYVGTYSEELENKWVEWESKVADFVGRYYALDQSSRDFTHCTPDFFYSLKHETNPDTEIFDSENKHDLPFQEILHHPEGSNLKFNFPISLFSRSATWGKTEKEIRAAFYDSEEKEFLSEDVPSFEPLEGQTKLYLYQMFTKLFPSLVGVISDFKKKDIQPVIIFCPSRDKMEKALYVGELSGTTAATGGVFNDKETPKPTKKQTTTSCDLASEKTYLDDWCKCSNQSPDDQQNPTPFLTDQFARTFTVSPEKSPSFHEIIFPSEHDYVGFLTVMRKMKTSIPYVAKHYGFLGAPVDALKFEVETHDITSETGDIAGINSPIKIDSVFFPMTPISPFMTQSSVQLELRTGQQVHLATSFPLPGNNPIPKRSLKFKIAGLSLAPFAGFLSPAKGLESISISYDENGISTSLSFATRPSQLPVKDVLINKITTKSMFARARRGI